jgi:hypothetical protein
LHVKRLECDRSTRAAHRSCSPVVVRKSVRTACACAVVEDSDERVALRMDAKRAGYLVLSDTYYPGWQATVDGRRAKVRPADVAFRAVAIPAGRHTVAFEYHPWSVKLGGALSLAALAAIALGLLLTRRGQLDRAPIIVLVDDHRSESHDADHLRVGRRAARVRALAECLLRPRRG